MSQQQEAAKRLAGMGFRVFPLIPYDKKPAIPRFPVAATTDPAQIDAWWNERPDCNVGVCTTGFVVVDIDVKKGPHALAAFRELGGDFNTFTVKTPTGGYHCYYVGPDSQLAVDTPAPGIDIRSHHGFVVGPGSVTSKINEGCVDGTYTVENFAPLAPVPLAVEIALRPPGDVRQRDDTAERDIPYNIENAKVALQTALPAIAGQGGNDATYRLCAKIVRDFALTPETAYQLLLSHWNERCIPPWSHGELFAIIQHADAYGTGDLGKGSPDRTFGTVTVPPQPEIVQTPAVQVYQPLGVYMGNALPAAQQTARPWKVEKLLMNGEVTVLGGVGAAGKSMFQLACAAHFAVGKDFGPFKLKMHGFPLRTLIYNGEDDTQEQSRRLLAVCQQFQLDYDHVRANIAFMDDRQGELTLVSAPHNVVQYNAQAVNFVIDTARTQEADILMFDPFVNLHACNENDNTQMRFLVTALKNIGRETNAAVLVAHHTGKGGNGREKGDADAFRGAGAIINSARLAILISSLTENDRAQFGIKPKNAKDFMRLDVGKVNMFRKDGEALAWLKWETVKHFAGDLIGVPTLALMDKRKADQDADIARIIRDAMRASGSGAITRSAAAKAIKASDHVLSNLSESGLRNIIDAAFENPLDVDDDTLVIGKIDGKELIVFR